MHRLSASLTSSTSHSEPANEAGSEAASALPADITSTHAASTSTSAPTPQPDRPSVLADLPVASPRYAPGTFTPPSSSKNGCSPAATIIPERPEQALPLLEKVRKLLLNDAKLALTEAKQIDVGLLEKAWSEARTQVAGDPKKFPGLVHKNYRQENAATRQALRDAAERHFHDAMTQAVQAGGYPNWAKSSPPGVPAIHPSKPSQWRHSKNAQDSQLTSTRIADFVLSQHSDLRTEGTELQAVASARQGKIMMSMNNDIANKHLQERYPTATDLRNDLGKFIANKLEKPAEKGDSNELNKNDRLRRATELFHWLGKNPDVVLKVASNPGGRHAEIAIRLELHDDPKTRSEGRAAGSKPPCTGCALWFSERGELSEYDDDGAIQVGPLFLTPNSGMRTQFEAAGVEPWKKDDIATDVETIEKLENVVARQVGNLKITLLPVTSGGVDNIPRSPVIDDPSTPDYNEAFEFGKQLESD